jgi:aldehyde:ferredoxin oxidoreductase
MSFQGTGIMVPGPADTAIDMTGKTLDRQKHKAMLKEFYRLRGWDENTGIPEPETLKKLGL